VAVYKRIFVWLTMLSVLDHRFEKGPKIDPFISTGALTSALMLLTALIGTPLFPLEQISCNLLQIEWLTTSSC